MTTMMPDWIHYEADASLDADLEKWEHVRDAFFRGIGVAKADSHTLRVDWPRQQSHRKLIEMLDSINAMLARFDEATRTLGLATQSMRELVDAQYRDVEDVARKAWHVSQRDEVQRIGAHAAWLLELECWRMVHPEGTFRGEDIRPFAEELREYASTLATLGVQR